jgi:hypothetical protein
LFGFRSAYFNIFWQQPQDDSIIPEWRNRNNPVIGLPFAGERLLFLFIFKRPSSQHRHPRVGWFSRQPLRWLLWIAQAKVKTKNSAQVVQKGLHYALKMSAFAA